MIKKFFKSKRSAYYVGLFVALITIITALVYYFTLAEIPERSIIPMILMLSGAGAFILLSLIGLDGHGAATMALLNFAAIITYVCTIYNYPIAQMMTISNFFDIPYIIEIILSAALMIICALLSNLMAWMPMKDKKVKAAKGGETDAVK